jgi:hypothetical protein
MRARRTDGEIRRFGREVDSTEVIGLVLAGEVRRCFFCDIRAPFGVLLLCPSSSMMRRFLLCPTSSWSTTSMEGESCRRLLPVSCALAPTPKQQQQQQKRTNVNEDQAERTRVEYGCNELKKDFKREDRRWRRRLPACIARVGGVIKRGRPGLPPPCWSSADCVLKAPSTDFSVDGDDDEYGCCCCSTLRP